ncbi:MAG TPA: translation initiation factor IF-2 [Candidatus Elarobacter sp.]|nr:translation initiation factor IF-2 [Candidatus Elarobacter sp.]
MATGKPRIFELAKELGMSSKDLLGLFGRLGLEAKNQLSVVEPKVADLLRAQLKGAKAAPTAARATASAAPVATAEPPAAVAQPAPVSAPVAAQPPAPPVAAPAPAVAAPALAASTNGVTAAPPTAPAAEPPVERAAPAAAAAAPAAPEAATAPSPPAAEPKAAPAPIPQLRPVTGAQPTRSRPAAAAAAPAAPAPKAAPEQPEAHAPQAPAAAAAATRPGVAPRPGQPGPMPPRRPVAPTEAVPQLQPVPSGQASIRPPRPPQRPMTPPAPGQVPGRPGVAPRPGQGGPGQYQQPRPGVTGPPGPTGAVGAVPPAPGAPAGRRPAGNGAFRAIPGATAGPRPFGGPRPGAPAGNGPVTPGGGPMPSSGGGGGRPGGGRGRSTREQLEAKKARDAEMRLEKQRRRTGGAYVDRVEDPNAKLESIEIPDVLTVQELATSMIVGAADVIKELFRMGTMATINQNISSDQAIAVARKFGFNAIVKEAGEEVVVEQEEDKPEMLQTRPPVVTVLGHVDHGKTSLLDRIRSATVAAGEAGGITQKIGAYTVVGPDGRAITFIDTPGHEAFTAMRARGAKVTDVAILVVAADDGVMPQTKEAISHIKAAGVPIVVAINKMDKEDAQPDRVKQQLTDEGLQPVEWGGTIEMVPVSARRGDNIDKLLETVLLEADLKELKANPHRRASGVVIESALDRGRGPVATVLVQTGTLRVGDVVVVGPTFGKVRALLDDKGKQTKKAGPSIPVEIMGLNDVPSAGDTMMVVSDEKSAREAAAKRSTKRRDVRMASTTGGAKVSLETFMMMPANGGQKTLNLILKADGQGSVEALRGRVESLSNGEVDVRVILAGVGGITENDVNLASASGAVLIGFNIRPDESVKRLAESEQVDLRFYQVIYDVENDLKKAMVGMLAPKFREIVLGRAEVREIFKVSKVGSIAGCYVQSGKITRNSKVRVLRDSAVVFDGEIESLRRFKDDVKEVAENFECGIQVARFADLKQGDVIEAWTSELVAPELQPA